MKKTSTITSILLAGMFLFSSLTNFANAQQPNNPSQTATVQKATYVAPNGQLVNLALESNGGEVLAASYDGLTALVDGKVDKSVGAGGGEMVIGFKGGRSAIVEKVTWFIKGTSDYNVKEFEILVSNESPTTGFKSVGKFTTQNIKLLKTPHQEFNFTPVKARYIKWKALSRHDGYNDRGNIGNSDCYELQVFGRLAN